MKIPLYYMWSDTFFYVYAALFAGSVAFLVYAIRRWVELRNASPYEENAAGTESLFAPEQDGTPPPHIEDLPPLEFPEAENPAEMAETAENGLTTPQATGEPEDSAEQENTAEPGPDAAPEPAAQPEPAPAESPDLEKTVMMPNIEELVAQATEEAAVSYAHEPEPAARRAEPAPLPAAHDSAKAEEFVKGIYGHIAGIEARLGSIEENISKGGGNRHFTVKFLEGILEDYDSLSVAKIKARVQYLITDLKENKPED